jgi:hypothetical protein
MRLRWNWFYGESQNGSRQQRGQCSYHLVNPPDVSTNWTPKVAARTIMAWQAWRKSGRRSGD